MKVFAQSSRCPSQVLFAFDEVVGLGVERVRWAVAYATHSGCERLVNRIAARIGTGWEMSRKCFIISLDFGLTEPAALEMLSGLPHSEVYIANPEVIGKPGFMPGKAYHPKLFLFDTGAATAYVVGSANLTNAALITNTEVVATGEELPGNGPWDAIWAELLTNTTPLTTGLLNEYRRKWARPRRRAVEPDPRPVAPTIQRAARPVFWEAITSGGIDPTEFDHFWVEAGSMRSGGRRNQLELPRGGNRFFGSRHSDYSDEPVTIDRPTLMVRGRVWTDRSLAWHGHNKMERFNLPTIAQGGFEYANTAILFRRLGENFEINVLPWGDDGAVAWRAASNALGTIFRLGKKSPRICGLY